MDDLTKSPAPSPTEGDSVPFVPPDTIRGWLLSAGRRLFTGPYLPTQLLVLTLFIIVSHAVFVLMGQQAGYWVDHSLASYPMLWIQQALAVSPLLFATVILGYLVVVAFGLGLLSRSIAIVFWLMLSFLHLRDAIGWARCGFTFLNLTDCDTGELVLTLIAAILLGAAFVQTLLSAESLLKVRPVWSWIPAGLAITWLFLLAFGLVQTINQARYGWVPVVTEDAPPPRINGIVAYDTARGRAVLFSGATAWFGNDGIYVADTWEWDGNRWHQQLPEKSPAGRAAHVMAFDVTRGVTVLFGGRNSNGALGDTWEWDGIGWHPRTPVNSPPPRCCHQMWFDSQRGRVVLYGGYDLVSTYFNDAWEWDGETWRPFVFESASPIASGFAGVYDEANQFAITLLSGLESGTWVWQGESWSQWRFITQPADRGGTSITYDPTQAQTILFGGVDGQGQRFNDTWAFSRDQWQIVPSVILPAARWGHTLFYDYQRQHVMLFGGFDGTTYQNDLWELVIREEKR